MPRVVIVDNYDSFTFNVADLLETLGARCTVVPNDGPTVDELIGFDCDAFLVSPGPCAPDRSGTSLPLLERAIAGDVGRPILGVCLGHQALAAAMGARIVRGVRPVHGKVSVIEHGGGGIFRRAPSPLRAAQYNSLVVDRASVPAALEETATSASTGEIMGLRHRTLPLESIQFHPESHLSEAGAALLGAWLEDVVARGSEAS